MGASHKRAGDPVTPPPSQVPTTATHEESARRAAARTLLRMPLVTARAHPDELADVRRHARYLTGVFSTLLGYRLVVEPSFARLVKEPPGRDAPWRGAARRSGAAFAPRTYTYLALVSASLLTAEVGEQVLLSRLVEQVRAEAQAAGVDVDDQFSDRRHLVAALEWLIDRGILEETDGTVLGWGERLEEALMTVNRNLLPHLLSRPLHSVDGPGALLDGTDTTAGPDQPRRSLRRKLVEHPVVRRDDLTDAERDVLSRERTELTRTLADVFGLVLEVRAEGALAFDYDAELTDLAFPGQGTIMQATLLLLDALVDTHRPSPGLEGVVDGRAVRGLPTSADELDTHLSNLVSRYGKGWAAQYTSDVPHLRQEVIAMLVALGLALADESTIVITPAAARYRPNPQYAPTVTRARARLSEHDDVGPSLFDEESST